MADVPEEAVRVAGNAVRERWVLYRDPRSGGTPLIPDEVDEVLRDALAAVLADDGAKQAFIAACDAVPRSQRDEELEAEHIATCKEMDAAARAERQRDRERARAEKAERDKAFYLHEAKTFAAEQDRYWLALHDILEQDSTHTIHEIARAALADTEEGSDGD